MANKMKKNEKVFITGKKEVSSPLEIPDEVTLVIKGELTVGGDDHPLSEKDKFLKHFGKPVKNSPKPVDELDQLIIEIANSEKDRSVDTIRNQIKKEL